MSNMSYCRFQNTLGDLTDCQVALEELAAGERALSAEELEAARHLAAVCFNIVMMLGEYVGKDIGEIDESDLHAAIADMNIAVES